MNPQLVVSLSGIARRNLEACTEFAAAMDQRGVPLTVLVAARPGPDEAALCWVRARLGGGDALALHGFDGGAQATRRVLPGLASGRPATALPGAEFAALPAHEAGLRVLAALAAMERFGLRVSTFVPPRWLASPGTVTALRRHELRVCADAFAVRDLDSGRVHRGRVHALGPGERAESWWCRALVLGAGRAARLGRAVRIAVDSADLLRAGPRRAVLDAVDLALHHGLVPSTYEEFATAAPVSIPLPRKELDQARLFRENLDPMTS